MTVFGEGGGVIFDGLLLISVTFDASPIFMRPRSRHNSRICTDSSGSSPSRMRSRSISLSSPFFLLSELSTAGSGNRSGIARRREIRQDTDFTQPDLPIRQMLQAVNHCSACGSVKELPVFQEIASASIDYVAGRIAVKINSDSLF